MSENEKLRGLLTRCDEYLAAKGVIYDAKLRREIRAALSQRAEPECGCCGQTGECDDDCDSRIFGRSEPAPAQDEREAFEQHYHRFDLSRDPVSGAYFDSEVRCLWDAWQARAARPAQTEQQPALMSEEAASTLRRMVDYCLNQRVCMGMDEGFKSFDPEEEHDFVKELRAFAESAAPIAQIEQQPVAWVSSGADGVEADWYPGKGLDTLPIGAKLYAAPIAQTEQQPVGYQFQDREGVWKQFMNERHYEDTLADGTWPIRAIYAAPIAQTAPQPQQVKAFEALQHAVTYLARSPMEAIHSGSALHKLMVAALPTKPET